MEVTPCQPESERASHQNESSLDVSGQASTFLARSKESDVPLAPGESDLGAFAL